MMIRILIVEDDWAAREGLCDYLGDVADFEVVGVAQNGQDALDLLAIHEPDVVVLDVRLPGTLSGLKIAEEIQARGWPTRVLAFSAYADVETVEALLRAGALGYYVKGGVNSQVDMVGAVRTVAAGEFWMGKGLDEWMAKKLHKAKEAGLTPRQLDVLQLLAAGKTNQEMAVILDLSLHTINTHVENIFKRLGVNNRTEAALLAREKGWLKQGNSWSR
ncbi:MAG: response regulator transcription factor [Anaerolineales bacterium]